MIFVHQVSEFPQLVQIVARSTGIAAALIDKAYAKISPMFWGPRIPLDEACDTIRAWLGKLNQNA